MKDPQVKLTGSPRPSETVIIETTGAGGSAQQKGFQVTNQGLIEGISDPDRVRGIIMGRLRESKTAGLGDESVEETHASRRWSPEHIAVLREIRDEIAAMKGRGNESR